MDKVYYAVGWFLHYSVPIVGVIFVIWAIVVEWIDPSDQRN